MPHIVTNCTMTSESTSKSFETRGEALDHALDSLSVKGWAIVDSEGGDDPERLVLLLRRSSVRNVSITTTRARNAFKSQHWDEATARRFAAECSREFPGQVLRIYRRPHGDHFVQHGGEEAFMDRQDSAPLAIVATYLNGQEVAGDSEETD